MDTVFVVLGPTASGKTSLSIKLAKEFKGEIISADSMQVYKYMDIGTAKPLDQEMDGIKHHLVDEVYPDEEFSVARFQELALKYMEEILSRGKTPIVTGGTGLYINSLIYNINFSETICDWSLREELKKEADEKGNEYVHDKLKAIDPVAAEKIHPNNLKRVIRALEVYNHTLKPISSHQAESRAEPSKYRFVIIGLTMDRERLYERINKRVDLMLEKGLIEEVRKLAALGYDTSAVAMQGLGYKEILAYLRGEASLPDTVYILKRDTRHYAKRQMTWFKRIENIFWFNVDEFKNEADIIKNIKNCIATSGIFL